MDWPGPEVLCRENLVAMHMEIGETYPSQQVERECLFFIYDKQ